MRAALRHSHRGTLETLAETLTAKQQSSPDERQRAAGFVQRVLIEWQGEPVYWPFLTDIGWRETT